MTPSEQIDQEIANLSDWRGARTAEIRALIHAAIPDVEEAWKWNTPVFIKNGMVCAIGAFKTHVKINFFKGATLPDPKDLFNAGLEAKATRSIDYQEADPIDEAGLTELLQAAVRLNSQK